MAKSEKLKTDAPETPAEPTPTFTVGGSLERPLDPVVNSIYYETDTGNRIRFTPTGWVLIDNIH